MITREDAQLIRTLHQRGWGLKRIARELGISRNTARRYVREPWSERAPAQRDSSLQGLDDWLRQAFLKHHGNAAVVHQLLASEHGVHVHLRTVQRAVAPWREQLERAERATVRFETEPGHQMQADFGQRNVPIAGESRRIHFAVLTLSYSRRCWVQAFEHERQLNWLRALESAFERFGGIPEQLLVDNARALVSSHGHNEDPRFNSTFLDFCTFWGTQPRACAPYRARTKGKVESGVRYVKSNALAGHEFDSMLQLDEHLLRWCDEVADRRVHGTTGEVPLERFERFERAALTPLPAGRFYPVLATLQRRVHSDACVQVQTNHYSVPWALIGSLVDVRMARERVQIWHDGELVASHPLHPGRHDWVVEPEHIAGIRGARARPSCEPVIEPERAGPVASSRLQRPLSEYAALIEAEEARR